MGIVESGSMMLRDFVDDSLTKTGEQIRESTHKEYQSAMQDFIRVIGNIDYRRVALTDAEYYRQRCLNKGNSPATVKKKLTEIKCVFGTAVARDQLDENPLKRIKMPKCPQNEINIYSDNECERILKTARDLTEKCDSQRRLRWDLLIVVALSTGLRRGELLNCTWRDVDFAEQTVKVSPKANTAETWEWRVKDTDCGTLALTNALTQLLVDHQNRQPGAHPYVFVPSARYDYIEHEFRAKGKWTYSDSRLKVANNFCPDFRKILRGAGIEEGTFHDLRRTAICNWFKEGMREYDVMKLADHADFKTTHKYYLRVHDDLVDRARQVTARGLCRNLLQNCCSGDFGLLTENDCQV
jgi:integrase